MQAFIDKHFFLFSNNIIIISNNISNLLLICVSKKSKKTNYQSEIFFIIATYFTMFLIYFRLTLWQMKTQRNMNLWVVWNFKYLPLGKKAEEKNIVSTKQYPFFSSFFGVNVSIKHSAKKRKSSIDLATFRIISLMKALLSPKFTFASLLPICLFTS